MRNVWIIVLCFLAFARSPAARAEVSVAIGPTPILRGDATGARDITVRNDLFAIAIAVDTAPPWGVAPGGIVDVALLRDGKPGYDIASLADFMPNNWSGWPTTYQRVTVEEVSAGAVIIKTLRDWGDVELDTTFRIRDGDSKIHITTRMTNKGEVSLNGLLSGYVVWPDGGYLIEEPVASSKDDVNSPGGWTAAYDEHWVLGLHAPFSDHVVRRGRDRYSRHDLEAGASRTFEAWLQIENDGTLAPMVKTEIDFEGLPSGRVSGRVLSNDGETVTRPAVVVSKNGKPFAWTLGNQGDYAVLLPNGNYDVYATAQGYAQGEPKRVTVSKGGEYRVDFDDVRPPGKLRIRVADEETGQPLDARIRIQKGQKPFIRYFGKDTFFTELEPAGETTQAIAPGNYVFEVSAGGHFLSTPQIVEARVKPGKTHELLAEISVTAAPREHGWYSADLHHHSDVLDGFTEAEYVLRAELAAGVDIAFLSDHDSVVNNAKMRMLSDARGLHFIPATELSPSWGHFNAYPLDDNKNVNIDTSQASVQEIFATARHMGADIVDVNHPYSAYGYFENLENGMAPGGFDAGFDLVEIESSRTAGYNERNQKTLKRVWEMWNEGHRAYLVAGSDAHDVWAEETGSARTYVYVDGDLSIDKFIGGLKAGRAFASQGPLVYPEILFGNEVQHSAGREFALKYSVVAVSGLRSVQLIERGSEIKTILFDGADTLVPVKFSVSPEKNTWYSLVIEDILGNFTYTNPVWVLVTN